VSAIYYCHIWTYNPRFYSTHDPEYLAFVEQFEGFEARKVARFGVKKAAPAPADESGSEEEDEEEEDEEDAKSSAKKASPALSKKADRSPRPATRGAAAAAPAAPPGLVGSTGEPN